MKNFDFFTNQTIDFVREAQNHQRVSTSGMTTVSLRRTSFLCFVVTILLALCAGEMWGGTRTIYCEMTQSWWTTDGAAIAAHYWGGDNGTSWPGRRMTSLGDGKWSIDIDDSNTNIIFVRVNGSGNIADWGAKTADLTLGDDNYYTITSSSDVWGDPGCEGVWSKYAPTPAIIGTMNSWKPDANVFSGTSGTVTCNIKLAANTSYQLKVISGTTYYGYGSTDNTDNHTYIGQTGTTTLSSSGNNLRLMSAGAGIYVFTYNCTSHTLSVTYPTETHPNGNYVYFENIPNWDPFKVHLWGGTIGTPWGNTQVMPSFTFDKKTYYYTAIGDNTTGLVTQKANDEWDYKTGDLSVSSHKGQYYYVTNKSTDESEVAANWKNFTATLTLDHQAATNTPMPNSITVTYNANTNLTGDVIITTPTKTGYSFAGYYTEAGGDGSQLIGTDENVIANVAGHTGADKIWIKGPAVSSDTVYAKWTQSVTLDKNGGSADGSATATYNAVGPLTPSAPTRTGYHIEAADGYYAETGCTNKVMTTAGALVNYSGYVESGKWVHAGATSLYAKWTANPYSITLNNQSATTAGTTSVSVTYDANTNLTSNITCPAKTNYIFAGYYTATSGGGVQVVAANGAWIKNVSGYTDASGNWVHADDVTLYAYWVSVPSAPSNPTYDACQVLPIFSPYYSTRTLSPTFSEWGSGSIKADRTVGGVNAWEVSVGTVGDGFFGIEWGMPFDVSGYTGVHFDVFTPAAQSIQFGVIDRNAAYNGNEGEYYVTKTTSAGVWSSINIPISDYTAKSASMLRNYQMKIIGNFAAPMLITNIYYYKTAACPAAPMPVAQSKGIGTAQAQNVPMFKNDNGNLAGSITNDTIDFYVATLNNEIIYKVATTHNHTMWTDGFASPQLYVLNNSNERVTNFEATRNAAYTIGTYEGSIPGSVGENEFDWNMGVHLVGGSHQWNGQALTDKMTYKRGYVNIPNSDETVPTMTSAALKSESVNDGDTTIVVTGGSDNSGQFFYYFEDEFMGVYHISFNNEYTIPTTTDGRIYNIDCYVVDFNGNMSAKQTVTIEMPLSTTTNLALNKPITIGAGTNATYVNDGNLTTRNDGANSDYINQWMYIDLKGYYTLSEIKIWFETACSDNFVLQAAHTLPSPANEDTYWRTIYTNTTTPNTGNAVGNVNTYDVSGSTARYVRIKSYHNYNDNAYGFAIWEFEVYGSAVVSKDATAPTVTSASVSGIVNDDELQLTLVASDGSKVFRITDSEDNVYVKTADASNHVVMNNTDYTYCTTYTFSVQAMDAAANLSAATEVSGSVAPAADFDLVRLPEGGVTATASVSAGDSWNASNAIDGSDDSYWATGGGNTGTQWLNIDLGRIFGVSSVKVAWNNNYASNLYIEGSRDGSNYYVLKHITTAPTNYTGSGTAIKYETYTLESHIRVRHIRLRAVGLTGEMAVRDVQIFGSCNDDYARPVMIDASMYRVECSSSGATARINVSAFDETTAAGSITYKAVFTTGALSDQTGLTATDGVITVIGLEEGTEYALRIYAYDGSNYSENYKVIASFTPRVSLYYLTNDATGTVGVWENVLSPNGNESTASKRRFSTTATSGVYSFSITATAEVMYRLYNDVEGDITYRNDGDHWSDAGNQTINGHSGETITVYAKDKEHFVSNFDAVYVYGAALNKATEGDAVQMTYSDGKFSWEGAVRTGTNAFRIIVKNSGSGFTDNSRARIMSADANWTNSSGWLYAKLTFDPATWEYEWGTADTFIFDGNGGASTSWSTAANWLNKAVPTIDKDVIIQAPVEVDITNARAKSVVIDQYSGNTGQLIIAAGQELVVAETVAKKDAEGGIVATGEYDIIFNSDASHGLGALVMGEHGGTNQATVNFYTMAHGSTSTTEAASASVSQYVGTPFGNSPKMLNQFYNSWMYRLAYPNEIGNVDWVRIDGDYELEAFRAYCVISADPEGHSYWMQGTLVAADDKTFNDLKCNVNGASGNTLANNEHMFANSWMAPIKICEFEASDFVNTTATIYIFNSGSPNDYDNEETSAGQYESFPINTAGDAVIPAMQAFSVYTYGTTGGSASLTLDYSRLVYDPAIAGTTPTPNKAPRRGKVQLDKTEKMHLYVNAQSGYKDQVYMLAHEDFSENFENGWDGTKIFGESVAPQLYALTSDGKMAVNCVPTLEGTVLGFRKGSDESIYTFTFDYAGEGEWYLNDLKEQCSTFISPDNTYMFMASYNDEARFIISHTPILYVPTGVETSDTRNQKSDVRKLIIDEHVYIIRNGRMYDATGVLVR